MSIAVPWDHYDSVKTSRLTIITALCCALVFHFFVFTMMAIFGDFERPLRTRPVPEKTITIDLIQKKLAPTPEPETEPEPEPELVIEPYPDPVPTPAPEPEQSLEPSTNEESNEETQANTRLYSRTLDAARKIAKEEKTTFSTFSTADFPKKASANPYIRPAAIKQLLQSQGVRRVVDKQGYTTIKRVDHNGNVTCIQERPPVGDFPALYYIIPNATCQHIK